MNLTRVLVKSVGLLCLATALTGCPASEPPPPTIEMAKTMWHKIHKDSRLDSDVLLVDLKIDGQMGVFNGVKVYTLCWEAQQKHITPMGNWKPGQVQTVRSNYGFQRTEKGWRGTDGELFSD